MADANRPKYQSPKTDNFQITSNAQLPALAATENKVPDHPADPFFDYSEIDATRWNKSYPYQLLGIWDLGGAVGYTLAPGWKFTLPIPPSELSISTPFAITTTVTMGGIVEEHGGAPLKMISFSGTTGVLPTKGTAETLKSTNGFAQTVFAGTLASVERIQTSYSRDTGGAVYQPNVYSEAELADTLLSKGSGYYQFRLLQKFLESYAAFKKTSKGRNLRLAFAMWKDEALYLVTPIDFTVRRSAANPFDYNYSLQLKAWRRIKLSHAPMDSLTEAFSVHSPNKIAEAMNNLRALRGKINDVSDAIVAVGGDIDRSLFQPMRSTIAALKGMIGVANTAIDLPRTILGDLKGVLKEALSLPATLASIRDNLIEEATGLSRDWAEIQEMFSPQNIDNTIDRMIEDPMKYQDLLDQVETAALRIPPRTGEVLEEEREKGANMGRGDYEIFRDQIAEFAADFADAIGAGDPIFNETYGRPKIAQKIQTPTEDQMQALFVLNETVMEFNKLASIGQVNSAMPTPAEYVAGLASESGIAFKRPRSKFAIPFPYGYTLEKLAAEYLDSPDRWIEIAALNGLQTPYVDEEGFSIPLMSNGRGTQLTVEGNPNLYIGQAVWISSNNVRREKRRVVGLKSLSNNNAKSPVITTVTLDGDPDLDKYITISNAKIETFLPDTVNSQMTIFIPSEAEPQDDDSFIFKQIPEVDYFDKLIDVGGIDLLLNSQYDLVLTSDGGSRYAYGLNNIVQTAKIAVSTPRGSLLRHPTFGLGIVPGSSVADVSAQELLDAAKGIFNNDPMFSGVQSASIQRKGPVTSITLALGISGVNQTIPLNLNI